MLDTAVNRKPAATITATFVDAAKTMPHTPIPSAEAMIKCLRSNRSTSGTEMSEPSGVVQPPEGLSPQRRVLGNRRE
jgi:hypothetical protein